MPPLPFRPAPDVAVLLNALLDGYERHAPGRPFVRGPRVRLDDLDLPGYASQVDPAPRLTANAQMQALANLGYVRLTWLPGEAGHLLDAVTLLPERAPDLFPWLERSPVAAQAAALAELLLGDRFRFTASDWRRTAVDHTLAQLKTGRSPAPFLLADPAFNRDLLTALVALDTVQEETPFRVFSVRTFNDSKAFEPLKGALATLARRHRPGWGELTPDEVLAELHLTPNPTLIHLVGPWRLVRGDGQLVDLDGFFPAVGVPAAMIAGLRRAAVDAGGVDRVVCVENLASFYELVRLEGEKLAAVCLWGNPAPAVRHLLALLTATLPADIPLQVWADLDYGGLNILAQLRKAISPRFLPYRMDAGTLEAHLRWARPLTASDRRHLHRLQGCASLAGQQDLLACMLERGIKLEQEAVTPLAGQPCGGSVVGRLPRTGDSEFTI